MINNISRIFVLSLILCGMLLPLSQQADAAEYDESFRIKLESILNRFKNYRFGQVSIWELKNLSDIKKAIKTKEKKRNATSGDCEEEQKKVDAAVWNLIKRGRTEGQSKGQVQRALFSRGITVPPNFDVLWDCADPGSGSTQMIRRTFLITNRVSHEDPMPKVIIAAMIQYEDEEDLKRAMDRPNPEYVFTVKEMEQFDLDPEEFGADNMYKLMMTAFLQNNVKNITLEAQGIGTDLIWLDPTRGVSKSIVKNANDITSSEIQTIMRISEGSPLDIELKENEVIISPDLISWKQYELRTVEYAEDDIDTVNFYPNTDLPKIGVELKYGIDEINYASLWSERMTLSALWQNVKLGVILPTGGWSSLSEDVFDQTRMLTHGGVGISGAADFPIKIIPKGGVFQLSGGYIFGDAEEASYKDRNLNIDNFEYQYNAYDNFLKYDYFIRGNAQLHYTFAISVDADYMLRFGIGATVYNVEQWGYKYDRSDSEDEVKYYKVEDETKGGISGKMDFMVRDVATPYGATLQYFDEALFGKVWIQFPVIDNTLSIRLDAKGYFNAFRDEDHPWEDGSVFTPMARFIVNF